MNVGPSGSKNWVDLGRALRVKNWVESVGFTLRFKIQVKFGSGWSVSFGYTTQDPTDFRFLADL